jgi:3-oxoacyl-[acyl-carrier protein] reductase/(S)-1-phenylethanol dehydrogenase
MSGEQRGSAGRVAVVTGAASGIGRAFALRLARDGADIGILDLADGSEIAAEVEALGRRAHAVRCDVASEEQVEAAAAETVDRLGKVDILVNNAGIYPVIPFEELDYEGWRRVLSINLDGTFLTVKAFAPGMKARGWGRIVNVASGVFWVSVADFSAYMASKAGVIGLTRGLANDLGPHGITVNAIAPGLVRTANTLAGPQREWFEPIVAQQAIKRAEEPDDLVGTLSFLVSEDAAFLTGQTLSVDGGFVRL